MNNFEENTWSAEQRALDGRIAADFESLEASRFEADIKAVALEQWQADAAAHAKLISNLIAGVEHKARREHWLAELARLGVAPPAEVVPVEITPPATEEALVEEVPVEEAPAEETPVETARPRRGRGG